MGEIRSEGPRATHATSKPQRQRRQRSPMPTVKHLVDRFAPKAVLPYLRLARADRPIGIFLLALPCFWSVSLAARSLGDAYPDPCLLLLFLIGAIVMRGAGCTYNDIVDRDIDAQVARTRTRPLPSGQVTPKARVRLHGAALSRRACRAAVVSTASPFCSGSGCCQSSRSIPSSSASAIGRRPCSGSPSIGAL